MYMLLFELLPLKRPDPRVYLLVRRCASKLAIRMKLIKQQLQKLHDSGSETFPFCSVFIENLASFARQTRRQSCSPAINGI